MMRAIKNILKKVMPMPVLVALFLMGGALSSCDDFLTDDPKNQISADEAYNSMAKLEINALLTLYNYIGGDEDGQGLQGTERGIYDLNSLTADEQIIPIRGSDWIDGGLWQRLFFHRWTAGEAPLKKSWDYLYKVVILCNEGIQHIDAFHTDNETEQQQLKSYRAELRALRAMFYFYLMDLYGRVPLVTETNIRSSEMTLCERQDLFYWIYNEFNEALPHLAGLYSQFSKSSHYGRMTVFVAYFVMMKMALNAEIYTDNDWTDNVYPDGKTITLRTLDCFSNEVHEANAWQTVRDIQNVIKAFFELSDFYSENFDVANDLSTENIFVIPMDPLLYANSYSYIKRSRHYCHGAALGGEGENGPCATVSAVRTFGYTGDENARPDARFEFNLYSNTVRVNDQVVYEEDGVTPLVYHPLAITKFDISGTEYEKTAGARMAKYSIESEARHDGRQGNNDIVLFRYADVLLMYAEASYRLGDYTNALNALNEVYSRSNNKKLTTIDEDVLLSERLKELMWEGWRRNDLIRFRRFHLPYDLKTDAQHEADAHTTVFPIPNDMMIMHPTWKQNPGY